MNKVSLLVIERKENLYGLQFDVIDKGNITAKELNKWGLHLNLREFRKLAINSIRKIKRWATAWRVTISFLSFQV